MADQRIGQIERYVNTVNPKLLGIASIGSVRVSEINRGGYNLNYCVDIDGKSFVFRLNLDTYLDVENQTVYEQDVMKAVEPSGIAPKAFFIDTNKDVLGYDLLVEEYLDHTPIKFRIEFLDAAGKVLKRLHAVSLPTGTKLIQNRDPLNDQWKFIQRKMTYVKAHGAFQKFVVLFTKYTPEIEVYVRKYAPTFSGNNICINHRDPVFENFLATDKGLRLVDWQAAMADDPSYDLAFFACPIVVEWNLGRPLLSEEQQAFFNGYQADEALLNKVRIRQPLTNLELLVWVAYRVAYLRDKSAKNVLHRADKGFIEKRIAAYEKLLDEKRMMQYLEAFHDHA